jgi:hypothetical protein
MLPSAIGIGGQENKTVFDYLKNKLQLEHTRHRAYFNMLVHVYFITYNPNQSSYNGGSPGFWGLSFHRLM